jgi:hypothetical protein
LCRRAFISKAGVTKDPGLFRAPDKRCATRQRHQPLRPPRVSCYRERIESVLSQRSSHYPPRVLFRSGATIMSVRCPAFCLSWSCSSNYPAASLGPPRSPTSNFATTVASCGMVHLTDGGPRAVGTFLLFPLHPRACALSCPSSAIYGPGIHRIKAPGPCILALLLRDASLLAPAKEGIFVLLGT